MNPRFLALTISLSGLLLLPLVCLYSPGTRTIAKAYARISKQLLLKTKLGEMHQLSPEELKELAQLITVKVFADPNIGSGILIAKEAGVYQVLTNAHVLTPGSLYRIQAPDGKIYQAKSVRERDSWKGNDLALLQFSSWQNYKIATLNKSELKEEQKVLVAGFPLDSNQLVFTTGKVSLLTDKAVKGGYQIGYTNQTQQGMSGSPVFNEQGQVIGIHGLGSLPILNETYTYEDGSQPKAKVREKMRQLSFAIPIETFSQGN